jgi:Fe-S-cluster containining protein
VSDSSPRASTKPPWYHEGLRFDCTRCGNCCSGAPGYVWVDADERARIAEHLGLTTETFTRRHVRRVGRGFSLLELPGGDCEFLERFEDATTGCRIHEVRPVQCRTWPFWKSNLRSERAWRITGKDCPGCDRGDVRPRDEIEAALRENGDRPL